MNRSKSVTVRDWKKFARNISLARPDSINIIRDRGSDVRIARAIGPDGNSVVIKLWNRRGWRSWIRRLTLSNPAVREWIGFKNMQSAGLDTPEAVCCLVGIRGASHTEAVVMRDLGKCANAVDHLKELIKHGDISGEEVFVEGIVGATQKLIHRGFLDIDHRLPNFIVSKSGKPIRLDFELIARRPWPRLWKQEYGKMLGTLIGSYVFAVQPDVKRVKYFAQRLQEVLNPPTAVLEIAEAQVKEMLEIQEKTTSIQVPIEKLWKSS